MRSGFRHVTPAMENHMERTMDNDMETVSGLRVFWRVPHDKDSNN